jgi:nucleoside transporter
MKLRLMVMMYLQFFIWGSWYATGGNYMKSHGMTDLIYLAYLASPIGSIISPFFLGLIADRYFSTQKVLGVMHFMSALFVLSAPFAGEASSVLFLVALLFHMLCYMPTVGLATATAFHLLEKKDQEFPLVRVFGTIGWISAGFLVSYVLGGDTTAIPMYVSAAGGVVLGLYSFSLPDIPPRSAGRAIAIRDIIGLDALRQLYSRPFAIFILGLLLISIPFAAYFAYVPVFLRTVGVENPAFKMTFGQMSEVVFLLAMPWFFRKLGVKWVLVCGLVAWTLRYTFFTFGAIDTLSWMLIAGILLHGACYDFVYVASQVYIDKKATPEIRAQAQGFFVLVSYGVGQGLGTVAAGWIFNSIMGGGDATLEQWQTFWTIPLVFSAVVAVMFSIWFNEKK